MLDKIDIGQSDYEDKGCWVHPACLSCPLPTCIYELDLHRTKLQSVYAYARWWRILKTREQQGECLDTQEIILMRGRTRLPTPDSLAKISRQYRTKLLKRYKEAAGNYSKFLGLS